MRVAVTLIALLGSATCLGCGGASSVPAGAGDPLSGEPAASMPDTTAPHITSVSGIDNGSQVAGHVIVEATAADDDVVATLALRLNGEQIAAAAAGVLVHDWDSSDLDPGAYVLTFTASDPTGNEGSDSVFVYVVDYEGEDLVVPGTGPVPSDPLPMTPVLANPEAYLPPLASPAPDPASDVPALIISGLANGEIVFGELYFSAVGFSRTGIDAIALLIDGKQVAAANETSIGYRWDTTQHADGDCYVTFIVRANNGKIGELVMQVEIDNTNDYSPPVLLIENSTWKAGELSGFISTNASRPECWTAGTSTLVLEAQDDSSLNCFFVSIGTQPRIEAQSNTISLILTPEDWESLRTPGTNFVEIHMEAMDERGHSSKRNARLRLLTSARISGYVWSSEQEPLGNIPVFLFEGAIEDPADCDPKYAVARYELRYSDDFDFKNLPFMMYTLFARYEGMRTCVVYKPGPGSKWLRPSDYVWEPIQ